MPGGPPGCADQRAVSVISNEYRDARYRCEPNSTGRPASPRTVRSMVSRVPPRDSFSSRDSAAVARRAPMVWSAVRRRLRPA